MAELEQALAALLQNGGLEKIREYAAPLLESLNKKEEPKQEEVKPSEPVLSERKSAPEPVIPSTPSQSRAFPFDENVLNKVRSAIDLGGVSSSRHLSLLSALRPYLSQKRCDRLDNVQGILRVSGVVKAFRNM